MPRNVYKHTIRGFYFLSEKEFIVTDNGTHFVVTLGKLIQTIYEQKSF
jgi:hypothetical protein